MPGLRMGKRPERLTVGLYPLPRFHSSFTALFADQTPIIRAIESAAVVARTPTAFRGLRRRRPLRPSAL